MAAIPIVEARALYTRKLIDVYSGSLEPTNFLRSFFPPSYSDTRELAIAVKRNLENVAVDVERGSIGNRNKATISTEKLTLPPLYREWFDITELSSYDRAWWSDSDTISAALFSNLLDEGSQEIKIVRNKIERAYELQAANILQTGIAVVNAGGINANIDFRRKAASMVDLGNSQYWDLNSTTVDPVTSLTTGLNFLRQVGKTNEAWYDAILGQNVLNALINNAFVVKRGQIFNYALDILTTPQRTSQGAALHGFISVGSYNLRLWTYPQSYDTGLLSDGKTPNSSFYIQPYNVILLPQNPHFKHGFARVPQLPQADMSAMGVSMTGNMNDGRDGFLIREFIDPRQAHWVIDVASSGAPIPTVVDQMYTIKATSF